MRCFIAIDLDPKLKPAVEKLQAELAGFDVKLVEPSNLHFTIKFLCEIDEDLVNKVKDELQRLVKGYEPFGIIIESVGTFPSEKLVRVVWLGAQPSDMYGRSFSLTDLQVKIDDCLSGLFKKEKPSPHLTIARVRSQSYTDEIIKFVNRHKDDKIGAMHVREIKLKKSIL